MNSKVKTALVIGLSTFLIFLQQIAYGGEDYNWHQDIARKLVAEGWEIPLADSPLVLYGVNIIELEEQAFTTRSLISLLLANMADEADLQISTDSHLLRIIADEYPALRADADFAEEYSGFRQQTTAWLSTSKDKPAALAFKQKGIGEDAANAIFDLRLLPAQISAKGEIKTEVNLETLSVGGHFAEAALTVWLKPAEIVPVGVITIREESRRKVRQRYFALFLQGEYFPQGSQPSPALTNVSNLNRLFENLTRPKERLTVNHEFKALFLNHKGGIGYEAQYLGILPEGLGLLCRIHALQENEATALIGLYDEIVLDDRLTFYAALLPLVWHEEFKSGWNFEAGLSLKQQKWSLDLALGQAERELYYRAAVQTAPCKKIGLEASVQYKNKDLRAGLGVVLRF